MKILNSLFMFTRNQQTKLYFILTLPNVEYTSYGESLRLTERFSHPPLCFKLSNYARDFIYNDAKRCKSSPYKSIYILFCQLCAYKNTDIKGFVWIGYP